MAPSAPPGSATATPPNTFKFSLKLDGDDFSVMQLSLREVENQQCTVERH